VTGAQVIGIDEWAKRKGRTYGTIVVDLERHTVVDVLDQHSSEAVEQWLRSHPDIQTICRDRNGRYARAARLAAPTATQVTDRFHLVQNLRETIERELALHRAYLRVRVTANGLPEDPPPAPPGIDVPVCRLVARERRLLPARRLATQTEISRQRRQADQHLFDTFKALQATGRPISVIAQQLGCNRRRLDKWAKQRELPPRQKKHPSPGSAETFREFLRQRWDAGCRNGRVLVDDLRALGYKGTYKAVGKIVSPWRARQIVWIWGWVANQRSTASTSYVSSTSTTVRRSRSTTIVPYCSPLRLAHSSTPTTRASTATGRARFLSRRTIVSSLIGRPRRPRSRSPARAPSAWPINSVTTSARLVRRPYASATPGNAPVKKRTAHPGSRQCQRPTRTRSNTAALAVGKSFRVRTYRL
jgi:hypothetical protein